MRKQDKVRRSQKRKQGVGEKQKPREWNRSSDEQKESVTVRPGVSTSDYPRQEGRVERGESRGESGVRREVKTGRKGRGEAEEAKEAKEEYTQGESVKVWSQRV